MASQLARQLVCLTFTFAQKKEQMPIVKFKGLALSTGTVEEFIITAFQILHMHRREDFFVKKKNWDSITHTQLEERIFRD